LRRSINSSHLLCILCAFDPDLDAQRLRFDLAVAQVQRTPLADSELYASHQAPQRSQDMRSTSGEAAFDQIVNVEHIHSIDLSMRIHVRRR